MASKSRARRGSLSSPVSATSPKGTAPQASQGLLETAAGVARINGIDVDAAKIRALTLTTPGGDSVALADVIPKEGKTVVVFLRHLG